MRKEENIEVFESMEFDYIKKTYTLLKKIKKEVQGVKVDKDIKRLKKVEKELDNSIENIKKFCYLINAEHYLITDLKKKSKGITKSL